MLKTALETISCLVFPKICETCLEILPAQDVRGVCLRCLGSIRKIAPPFCPNCGRSAIYKNSRCGQCRDTGFYFDHVYAAAYYEGKMQELLQSYKFKGRKFLKTFLSELLTEFISNHLHSSDFDAVLSVPMEARKENERGFNQSLLLSRLVSKKIQRPDLSAFVGRKKLKHAQSLLNKNQRAENISGSFAIKNSQPYFEKNLLLVDDILTTGFTASECSKTLKTAGARSVTVLAVARGL